MIRELIYNEKPTPADVLIFDAPLTNGDLTDHVSGISATYGSSPNGSVTWDSAIGAYKFDKSGYGQCCVWKNLNLGWTISPNLINNYYRIQTNFRLEIDVYYTSYWSTSKDSYWLFQRCCLLGGYVNNTSTNTNFLLSAGDPSGSMMTLETWHHITSISNWSDNYSRTTYLDGILVNTETNSAIYNNRGTIQPSWVNSNVSIGKNDGSSQRTFGYFKNIKLYKIN